MIVNILNNIPPKTRDERIADKLEDIACELRWTEQENG